MFDPPVHRGEPGADGRRDGVVLGIDPGLSRCGYGAVHRDGAEVRTVAYGVLRTPPTDPLPERLAALEADLEGLVAELAPSAMAVERLLFQVNVRSAIAVGQASGLALAVASRAGVPVVHYSPNEVKQAVAGYGAADKAQVQDMVTRLLQLGQAPDPPDAADALALALCHSWTARTRVAIGVALGRAGAPDPAAAPAGRDGRGDPAATGLARAVAAALAREARR